MSTPETAQELPTALGLNATVQIPHIPIPNEDEDATDDDATDDDEIYPWQDGWDDGSDAEPWH